MKMWGIVLISAGVLALIFGEIGYSRQRTLIDLGPIQATTTEKHEVPISPILGAVAIVGGLLLMVTPKRRMA